METLGVMFAKYWIQWLLGGLGTIALILVKVFWKQIKKVYQAFKNEEKQAYLSDINTKIENYHTEVNTKIENYHTKIEDYHTELEDFKMISLGADQEHEEQMEKILGAIDALREGILSAHFNTLLNKSMKFVKRGWISVEELELYEEELEIYKHLKGNGHMDSWVAKVRALPNKKNKGE